MHHIRVSGVCLLILLIAATLPFNVLAQESSLDIRERGSINH